MKKQDEKTIDELWREVEMWFDGIEAMLSHRCYQPRSLAGARSIQFAIAGHLKWIDQALLEIEVRAKLETRESM